MNNSFSLISTESEDPFDYVPLNQMMMKKRKLTTPIRKRKTPKPLKIENSKNSVKKNVEKEEKFCSVCQMPFELLFRWESVTAHASACLDIDFEVLPKCPYGVDCDVETRGHFQKFNHFALAAFRMDYSRRRDRIESSPPIFESILPPHNVPTLPPHNEDGLTLPPHNEHGPTLPHNEHDPTLPHNVPSLPPHNEHVPILPEKGGASGGGGGRSTDSELGISSSSDLKSPLKFEARAGKNGYLNINLEVDPSVELKTLSLKIPPTRGSEDFISSTAVTTSKKQSLLTDFFRSEGSKKPSLRPEKPLKPLRKCPFYKKIANFPVDAFSYGDIPGARFYFLTHFHYDHYIGLTKDFKYKLICSPVTARLVSLKLKVDPKRIRALELDETVVIDSEVEVTLLDANHCPGAVMILFKFPGRNCVLHTGDFRAHTKMEEFPPLWNNSVDIVHLDTTYCSPEYDFPDQDEAIEKCISLIRAHLDKVPETLILVESYTIGKERILTAIAEAFDSSIWTESPEKYEILKAIRDPEIEKRLTKTKSCRVHVVQMSKMKSHDDLDRYLKKTKFKSVLAVKPSGWHHKKGSDPEASLNGLQIIQSSKKSNVWTLKVPYSEHSSFSELERFVKFLKLESAEKVIPTVNIESYSSRYEMKKIFQSWIEKL